MAVEFFVNPVRSSNFHLLGTYSTYDEKYTISCNFAVAHSNLRGHIKVTWLKASSKLIRISGFSDPRAIAPCFKNVVLVSNQTEASLQVHYAEFMIVHIIPRVELPEPVSETPPNTVPSGISTETPGNSLKEFGRLAVDMLNLLKTEKLSDIVITDGSTEIRAHKLVLAARSPVFAKMFQHPVKENLENKITIPDIPIKVVKVMLVYLYTGSVAVEDRSMALDLYNAAEKYDIEGLRDLCTDVLKAVNMDSFFDTLTFADMCDNKILTEAAMDFACKNYSQLKNRPEWDEFKNKKEKLVIELLSRVIDRKT